VSKLDGVTIQMTVQFTVSVVRSFDPNIRTVCVLHLLSTTPMTVQEESDRATAQAVSRRLPTAAARFQPGSSHVGFMVDEVALRQVFSRVLRFPLPILIPPTAPHSSVVLGWYSRPNSGGRAKWTQSQPTRRNLTSGKIASLKS
jgi:hypothetical protein